MNSLNITVNQYRVFLVSLGAYLVVHFGYLAIYASEVFSSAGMLGEASLSPLWGLVPTLFTISDSALFVTCATASGVVAAVALILGRGTRCAAGWMLILLISLFVRNPLIANPAMPYLGFMLLLHLFVPILPEPRSAVSNTDWRFPGHLFFAASVVLAISYSYSGYTKLLSPGWLSGETLHYVLQNPLARDWWLRDLFVALPDQLLQGLTWFILGIELLYAPLALLGRARFALWLSMLVVQFGFLLLLSFPDLTIAMLLFHLLTFDPRWIAAKPLKAGSTLYYDGDCGLCHNAVRFALREVRPNPDEGATLGFRAMQSDGVVDPAAMRSWKLETQGQTLEKTAALLRLLQACGGLWRVLGLLIALVPRSVRDYVYDQVANNRRRLGVGQPEGLCPLIAPELRQRFS